MSHSTNIETMWTIHPNEEEKCPEVICGLVNSTEWITKQVSWSLQLSKDAIHDDVKEEEEEKCEWTFYWANELNKWKRVIKASKCKRFRRFVRNCASNAHFFSLFSLHCNQTKWDLDTVWDRLLYLFCANKITWPKRYQAKRITKSRKKQSYHEHTSSPKRKRACSKTRNYETIANESKWNENEKPECGLLPCAMQSNRIVITALCT